MKHYSVLRFDASLNDFDRNSMSHMQERAKSSAFIFSPKNRLRWHFTICCTYLTFEVGLHADVYKLIFLTLGLMIENNWSLQLDRKLQWPWPLFEITEWRESQSLGAFFKWSIEIYVHHWIVWFVETHGRLVLRYFSSMETGSYFGGFMTYNLHHILDGWLCQRDHWKEDSQ